MNSTPYKPPLIARDVRGDVIEVGDIVWQAVLWNRSAGLEARRVTKIMYGTKSHYDRQDENGNWRECIPVIMRVEGVEGLRPMNWSGKPSKPGTIFYTDRCVIDMEQRAKRKLREASNTTNSISHNFDVV